MPEYKKENRREHRRVRPVIPFKVNDGSPYEGGTIYDVSATGVAVTYPKGIDPTTTPVEVDQDLSLIAADTILFESRVVRVFENGFACKFEH